MEESVSQLKRLHAIENVEHAIFALERGMPVPPRIIDTLKMLYQVMVIEYNNTFVESDDGEAPPEKETSSDGGQEDPPSE